MKTIKTAKVRTEEEIKELSGAVAGIIANVREKGDAALAEYNANFDDCHRDSLRVSAEEIAAAYALVEDSEIEDIRSAAKNIRAFAEAQRGALSEIKGFATVEGADLGHRIIPVDAAGCYVPGGNYPLYSTALMLGIPAKVAGVDRVVGCSPAVPGTNTIHPKTLVAMDIAGMDEIYVTGGAGAIAGLTYGTESIAPVNMIVGPGNAFVTEAKRQCYGKVGIDFLAGPSEVLVIADASADPGIVAADLLAQSEHDVMAKGLLVALDEGLATAVIDEVEKQLQELDTEPIAGRSWADFGEVLLAETVDEAIEFANTYAPEHLEVIVSGKAPDDAAPADADASPADMETYIVEGLRNYGSLFIGQNTAEVFGDYASGTNHTLPTMQAAKYTGGVFVGTFLKFCTYQKFTHRAGKELAPLVERLAKGESLSGHANAARLRK